MQSLYEHIGLKTAGVTDYTNQMTFPAFWKEKNVYVQHPSKMRKKIIKCAQNR